MLHALVARCDSTSSAKQSASFGSTKSIYGSSGMSTKVVEEQVEVRRYKIQYPISAYTYPLDVKIHRVDFDDEYIHVELIDGRRVSIPLWWIPTLHNAPREELDKYEINRERTVIAWDPDKCAINDELRIVDYLLPHVRREAETEAG